MGCCCAKSKTLDIMTATYGGTLNLLNMQGKAYAFVKIFEQYDEDNSGTIDLIELLDIMDIPKTKFTRKAFKLFDSDGSGALDFRELLFSIWNFCTMDADGLLMLIFDLYDKDGSGSLTSDELELLVRDVHNAKGNSAVVNRLVGKLKSGKYDGKMLRHQFVEFGRANGQLLMPAMDMQVKARAAFIGESFWRSRTKARVTHKDAMWQPKNWMSLRSKAMAQDIAFRKRAAQAREAEGR